MKKITLITLFTFLILSSAACGGPGRITYPLTSFADINSPDSFDEELNREGDASGSGYSGAYDVLVQDITYSSDCEASFVEAYDFAIDTSLDEVDIEYILENGSEDQFLTLEVVQEDGLLIVEDLGDDEEDLTGAVYADGSFRIVFGSYDDENNYSWSDYQGVFNDDDTVEGTFESQIHVEDYEPSGSCTVAATFTGDKM